MKIILLDRDRLFKRYVRLGRDKCKNSNGYDRANRLCSFFESLGLHNANQFFDDLAGLRSVVDRRFNSDLLQDLARALADQNEGFVFTGIDGIWRRVDVIENVFFEHAMICRYTPDCSTKTTVLLSKEQHHEVMGYRMFNDMLECDQWLKGLKQSATGDLNYLHVLAHQLS